MKYYKNRYLIALYNKDDELLTVLDNPTELADYLEISKSQVGPMLTMLYKKQQEKIFYKGVPLFIYFIDMKGDENED